MFFIRFFYDIDIDFPKKEPKKKEVEVVKIPKFKEYQTYSVKDKYN